MEAEGGEVKRTKIARVDDTRRARLKQMRAYSAQRRASATRQRTFYSQPTHLEHGRWYSILVGNTVYEQTLFDADTLTFHRAGTYDYFTVSDIERIAPCKTAHTFTKLRKAYWRDVDDWRIAERDAA